mgnify:CR=1 FL=1
MEERKQTFDFYDQTYFKTYNLDKAIQYQLNLLDSLDVYTREHSENVATITCNLCKKLHCNKGFTEYCTICAYMHDIGKLFIPAEILQKPSALTDEEYEIMKKHTTLGYKLCIKDTKLRPYYAGPYYHHEALDGTGYPQGLVKKDIPFEAQIIRVADEYDALVHKRQYKSHVGISEALKIIIENTKPTLGAPEGTGFTKAGKNNKLIVKKLIKVVIDDIEYEIACTIDYVKFLDKELDRYKKIENYIEKKASATKEKDIVYYDQYISYLLKPDESIENFQNLYQEFKDAYHLRKDILQNLHREIKIVKKLKV